MTYQDKYKITKLNAAKLRIKVKNLAEEARIIRKEEGRFRGMEKWDLQNHRTWNVRNECRATQLALAFMKGKPYSKVEPKCTDTNMRNIFILPRVVTMIDKYCSGRSERAEIALSLKEWFSN